MDADTMLGIRETTPGPSVNVIFRSITSQFSRSRIRDASRVLTYEQRQTVLSRQPDGGG